MRVDTLHEGPIARQALGCGVGEDLANHALERVLHQKVVADEVLRHSRTGSEEREEKVEASVARRLRAPPYGATRKDLVSVSETAYAATATGA